MEVNVEGRSKNKWLDAIRYDMRTAGMCVDVEDWVKWRLRI